MVGIEAIDVSVTFPLYQGTSRSLKKVLLAASTRSNLARDATHRIIVRALDRATFSIRDGERIALIGRNGAGKTTLLRVLAGIFEPSGGTLIVNGSIATLLESSLGLDPDSTGRENILLRGMYLGVHPREMRYNVDEIAEFAELGSYIDMPVRTYSAGMMMRLAFATATCIKPEILLMDEWIATGDMHFVKKAEVRLATLVSSSRIMVFATHSMALAEEWCSRAILLDQGHIVAMDKVSKVVAQYHAMG